MISHSKIVKSLQAILFDLKIRIRKIWQLIQIKTKRTSKRDYCFWAGLSATAFLFCFFFSSLTARAFPNNNFSFLDTENSLSALVRQPSKYLFLDSIKNFTPETPEMILVQKNSLAAITAPVIPTPRVLGIMIEAGPSIEDELNIASRSEIIEYQVQEGDTLSLIAQKFGISLNTLLWANDLTSKSSLKLSQKLIILPVSGVLHTVRKGETLSQIALIYKAKTEEIAFINELDGQGDIFAGDILIIPNGIKPAVKSVAGTSSSQVPLGSSYFICPHSACRITQGLHYYNAIDFGGHCGDPLYAAAAGVVQRAKTGGWNGGAGNYVTILHPNGATTLYAHMQKVLVIPGQQVSQGQVIGLMGGKPGTPGAGNSTGCHVHFSVTGAVNPF